MQTSAKTKAKEFMETWGFTKEDDKILINALTKLLLEHERDTRYTAIEIINNMDSEWVYDTLTSTTPHINTEDTLQKIHNMKVGV